MLPIFAINSVYPVPGGKGNYTIYCCDKNPNEICYHRCSSSYAKQEKWTQGNLEERGMAVLQLIWFPFKFPTTN